MNELIAIARAPLVAGIIYPQIYLAVALLVLKLFDAWSTNYIVGRKGGRETMSLATWCIEKTGSVKKGLALDFVLVAVAGWFMYATPWYLLGGVVAGYLYWMFFQWQEVMKSRPR